MGKRDRFWENLPFNGEDQILWPEDPEERNNLIRDVFGAKVIGAVEFILQKNLEIAAGKPPIPGENNYKKEEARRRVFAEMTDAHRSEISTLLRETCFSSLYWMLVKLKGFPGGDVDFTVTPYNAEGETLPKVGLKETELYFLYFDWIKKFSDLSLE